MNPFIDDDNENREWLGDEIIGLEGARVATAPSHTAGDDVQHSIEVKPDTYHEPLPADVRVGQQGDVAIPTKDSRVVIGYRMNGKPLVLGVRYSDDDTIPEYEAGERIIGHPLSNAHIHFKSDGTIQVNGDGGNTVALQPDGSVVVNGGATQPVMDVATTKDADGHVTSISLTRANNVYLPK